jgi:hypothetical protein
MTQNLRRKCHKSLREPGSAAPTRHLKVGGQTRIRRARQRPVVTARARATAMLEIVIPHTPRWPPRRPFVRTLMNCRLSWPDQPSSPCQHPRRPTLSSPLMSGVKLRFDKPYVGSAQIIPKKMKNLSIRPLLVRHISSSELWAVEADWHCEAKISRNELRR